jgi:hypothetical protein
VTPHSQTMKSFGWAPGTISIYQWQNCDQFLNFILIFTSVFNELCFLLSLRKQCIEFISCTQAKTLDNML